MKDIVHFFDPTPLCGVLQSAAADGDCRYPYPVPAEARTAELLDAELETSGIIILSLRTDHPGTLRRIALQDVTEGSDGSMGLRLAADTYLVFAPRERERVSNMFLKLANRHY